MRLGPFQIDEVRDGDVWLDGGAMFGVVPRPLWSRTFAPDAQNRIRLAQRCLLVRDGVRTILIDDGLGARWSEKDRRIYGIAQIEPTIDGALEKLGVAREDVTDVILTHLHFDHAGGTTRIGDDGALCLSFPRAMHHLQRRNWTWAQSPTERDRASYRAEDFALLETSGRLHLIDGPGELFPGIELLASDGHTPGLQLVRLGDDSGSLTYCADLIPTRAHLKLAWGMGYDLAPLTVMAEKKKLLESARPGAILCFEHDPEIPAVELDAGSGEWRERKTL